MAAERTSLPGDLNGDAPRFREEQLMTDRLQAELQRLYLPKRGADADATAALIGASVQAELEGTGVGVFLVSPGMVRTDMTRFPESLTRHKPYLADIPVIGFFFKGSKRESKQSSLLIFVTPDIIDSTGARFFDIAGDKPAY